MGEKDDRLAAWCRARGVEGVLLRRRSNIAWITDGADAHCDTASPLAVAAVEWRPGVRRVHTNNIESARLATEEFGPRGDWEFRVSPWWERPEPTPAGLATDWPDDPLQPLRASLTDGEMARVRTLGRDAADAMESAMKAATRGVTEHEAAASIGFELRRRGIFPHVLLVAADDRIACFRHPIPTERRAERALMGAICAQRGGLIVSITRLVHFGPVPDDLRRRHDAVVAADLALHRATRAGTRWCDALAAGVAEYAARGFADEWQLHHQGGPMGYECRDFVATPTEVRTVADRQLVGWNPTVSGTKSEDTIIASGDDAEVVTRMVDWPERNGRPDILVRPAV